jgi:predicted PurR-regulated permease PerM
MTTDTDGVTLKFVQRVLFIALVLVGCLLAVKMLSLWLLIFGAIIVASILRAIAEPLIRYARMPDKLAVLTAFVLVVGLFGGSFYLFGREVVGQTENLKTQLPVAWAALKTRLDGTGFGQMLQSQFDSLGQQAGGMLSNLPGIAGNIMSSLASLLVATSAGVVLAMDPRRYRDGMVSLLPVAHRERVRDAMNTAGHAIRLWLIGQSISMVFVGTCIGVGLAIIGVPSALALGLFSGVAQLIPLVGPLVAGVAGLLLAGMEGWQRFAWALAVYIIVPQIEANLLTPTVQSRLSSVPMVLILFALFGFGILLGPIGVLYAMPLTVVLYTLAMRFYHGDDLTKRVPKTRQRKKPAAPEA